MKICKRDLKQRRVSTLRHFGECETRDRWFVCTCRKEPYRWSISTLDYTCVSVFHDGVDWYVILTPIPLTLVSYQGQTGRPGWDVIGTDCDWYFPSDYPFYHYLMNLTNSFCVFLTSKIGNETRGRDIDGKKVNYTSYLYVQSSLSTCSVRGFIDRLSVNKYYCLFYEK